MRHYYHYCPFPYYDVEGVQLWLEEQARKGYFLSKRGFIHFYGIAGFIGPLAVMLKGEPKEVRYRMISTTSHTGDDSGMYQMAKELGWQEVTEHRVFLIYYTDDPTLTELHTDPQLQAIELRKVRNISLAEITFWYGLDIVHYGSALLFPGSLLANNPTFDRRLFTFNLLLYAVTTIFHLVSFYQQEHHLCSGQLFLSQGGWRKKARNYHIFRACYWICLGIWLWLTLKGLA